MDWTVCSRETERDYTWDNTHATHSVAESAQEIFAPAFEGSLTTSRFVALLRCPSSPSGVMLGVSVSTARKDFRNRPIRTMAFLRAETPEESNLLAAFFAECLRKPDKETLCAADSPLAQAVESLYQRKKPDKFIAFCNGLPKLEKKCNALAPRLAVPRENNIDDRKNVAGALPSLVEGAVFLLALTDRLPSDVLASLGSMFDHAPVRIFSKAIDRPEKLPEPVSQKYVRAATIGCVAIFAVLVAAVGSCSRGCGKAGDNDASKDAIGAQGCGTNAAPDRGIVEANDQTDRTCGGTSSATDRVGFGGNLPGVSTNVPPQAQAETVNEAAPLNKQQRKETE